MKALCERLLGRSLQPADGIDLVRLSAAEQRLGVPLPPALRELYAYAGNVTCLMESFQRFPALEQLEIEDGKLIFLEENQGVCFWGVERGDQPMVSQRANENALWHSEELQLDEFLRIILYYQCAQGGYDHAATVSIELIELLQSFAAPWEKVVEHNGLHVYWQPDVLIWWLKEGDGDVECVFLSARTREAYRRYEDEYALTDL
jgi:hypothetical protein